MSWQEGDRVYDKGRHLYGEIVDISDLTRGHVTVQYDNNDIGYVAIDRLEREIFDVVEAGNALANSLAVGATTEAKSTPWKTTRQLLKYSFDWWLKESASKTIQDDIDKLKELLRVAERQLGYEEGDLEAIWEHGWEHREPELELPSETALQWQETSIEELAKGLYNHIKGWLTSSAKTVDITDWRELVEDGYDDWVLHNAPESIKHDPEQRAELQRAVTKLGIDISDIGSSEWMLRNQGKEVRPIVREDWISQIEQEVGAPEVELEVFVRGDTVWDPQRNMGGEVFDVAEGGEVLYIKYDDGHLAKVSRDSVQKGRPPSAEEMGSMFRFERRRRIRKLLRRIATTPLVLKHKPNKKSKELLLELVQGQLLKPRVVKGVVVFGLTKKGHRLTGLVKRAQNILRQVPSGKMREFERFAKDIFEHVLSVLRVEYPDVSMSFLIDSVIDTMEMDDDVAVAVKRGAKQTIEWMKEHKELPPGSIHWRLGGKNEKRGTARSRNKKVDGNQG